MLHVAVQAWNLQKNSDDLYSKLCQTLKIGEIYRRITFECGDNCISQIRVFEIKERVEEVRMAIGSDEWSGIPSTVTYVANKKQFVSVFGANEK
jgi:hypothetical protein